ncbi:MAG: DnaJ family molecular chaperone [Pseudomonadota bacterium]
MIWQRITAAVGDEPPGVTSDKSTLRAMLDSLLCGLGIGDCRANNEVAFTAAIVALAGKMSKADGVATPVEFDAFHRIFRPPADEEDNVRWLYELATYDTAGFESYASQIENLLADEPQLKQDVYDGLFYIAAADGVLHEGEEAYLRRVAEIFGYDERLYRSIRAQFVSDPDDAYTVLGVDRRMTDNEIKAHYRALARENHPDALAGRGVPKQFIEMASRKLASLNVAYEQIAQERGL